MLSLLTLGSFVLPAESGEKVSLGLTVLLAFSVFMLLIAESMPATSEFVPLIGMYSLPYRQHRSLTHSFPGQTHRAQDVVNQRQWRWFNITTKSCALTVLLAFSVFMLLIAESMPATSEFVPLIGMYSLLYRQHRSPTHSFPGQTYRAQDVVNQRQWRWFNITTKSCALYVFTPIQAASFALSLTHRPILRIPNYNCLCMWFSVSNIAANQLSQHL